VTRGGTVVHTTQARVVIRVQTRTGEWVKRLVRVTRAQLLFGAEVGLCAASAAMMLLVWEAVLGLLLSAPCPAQRHRLRRRHLVLMAALVMLVTVHVQLNGPVPC
jgi:hypothetical protein